MPDEITECPMVSVCLPFQARCRDSHAKHSLQPPPAASTSKKSNIPLPDYQQTLPLTCPPLLATLLVSLPVLLPSRGEPSLAPLPNSPASIPYRTGHKAALSWHPPWAGCPRNMMGLVRSSTSPAQVQSNFRFPKCFRQCSVVHQHRCFQPRVLPHFQNGNKSDEPLPAICACTSNSKFSIINVTLICGDAVATFLCLRRIVLQCV